MGLKDDQSELQGVVTHQHDVEIISSRMKAQNLEGIQYPSLSQIFSEHPQLPPALGASRTGPLPPAQQEDLLKSLQNTLNETEPGDSVSFGNVLDILYKLWNCKSEFMVQAAEALANGSRNPSFRLVYGQSGILSFFLQLVASEEVTDSHLILHSLRLIGNSCADTNENRAVVVNDNYTFFILRLLLKPELIQVVIPVIYNLCIDFEPAQSQLASNKVVYILLKLVNDGAFKDNDALLSYVYELIELIAEQEQGIENSPDGTLSFLISLPMNRELSLTPGEFSSIANCLVAYLEKERFQMLCISKHMVADVLSILRHSLSFPLSTSPEDEVRALSQCQLKINQVLAELSSLQAFTKTCPLSSPLSHTLKSYLTATEDQLQICACIMLGNLARSDEVCEVMVKELKIHEELIAILNSGARGAVLHSALGFLKNLAIASDNRLELGNAGIIPAVSRLWSYESVPQVQLAATSITRQLIISSVENISRLLESPPSADGYQAYLSLLLALFGKSDSTPIKTEIGRIVASMCRTLVPKSREQDPEAERLLRALFSLHPSISHPIGAMISQSQWPVVRSEGWFALALMASSKQGSLAVVDCLQKIDGLSLLKDTLGGDSMLEEETPANDGASNSPVAKDRENMVVLVQEVLRNDPDTLPESWKSILQEVMNTHVSKYIKNSK